MPHSAPIASGILRFLARLIASARSNIVEKTQPCPRILPGIRRRPGDVSVIADRIYRNLRLTDPQLRGECRNIPARRRDDHHLIGCADHLFVEGEWRWLLTLRRTRTAGQPPLRSACGQRRNMRHSPDGRFRLPRTSVVGEAVRPTSRLANGFFMIPWWCGPGSPHIRSIRLPNWLPDHGATTERRDISTAP